MWWILKERAIIEKSLDLGLYTVVFASSFLHHLQLASHDLNSQNIVEKFQ